MEEEKKAPVGQGQGSGQGGRNRRRRHRHHKGGQGGQNAPQSTEQTLHNKGQQNVQKPQGQKLAQGQQKPQGNRPSNGQNPSKKKEEKKVAPADNRKDTYVYVINGNLYINLTNKCCNGCDFCVRNERNSYYGNYLWIRHGDPTAQAVISALNAQGDLSRFKEGVFCGFGEPTYRMAEMVAVCDYLHEKGLKTRLNTNGQGTLVNKRDIVPELKGKIDFVNISLNASCAEKYQPICRSQFGAAGFDGMVEFAKSCKRNGLDCRFSIVDCIGEEEIEACKRFAQSLSIPLHVRAYIQDS